MKMKNISKIIKGENMTSIFKELLSQKAIPPYLIEERDTFYVVVEQMKRRLFRRLIIEYDMPIESLLDEDGVLSKDLYDPKYVNAYIESEDYWDDRDEGFTRSIPVLGQMTRIRNLLFEAIQSQREDGTVAVSMKTATSIMDFHMIPYNMAFVAMDPKTGRAIFLGKKEVYRQAGYLDHEDDLLVQIVELKEGVIDAFESLKYPAFMEKASKFKFDRGTLTASTVSALVKKELKLGKEWFLIGGKPNSGSVLLSRRIKPGLKRLDYQKLTKIILSGGIIVKPSFNFVAVDFHKIAEKEGWTKDTDNPTDGIIGVISHGLRRKLEEENGVYGYVYHMRILELGVKGTIASPITDVLHKLLVSFKNKGYEAIIDLNEINKVFGNRFEEGDIVEVPGILVLKTDEAGNLKKMFLNHQALERAGASKDKFLKQMLHEINNIDPGDFIPDFGIYKPMKKLGKLIEWKNGSLFNGAAKLLDSMQMRIFRKGVRSDGGWLYNLPSTVKPGSVLISKEFIKKYKLKIGDEITIIISPALFPNGKKKAPDGGDSEFVFSVRIAGDLLGKTISLSWRSNKTALRDFDGDFIVNFKKKFALSQPMQEVYTSKAEPKREFEEIFHGNELDLAKVFHSNSSNVGSADNLASTANVMDIHGKVSDSRKSHTIQGQVENQKHNIILRFLLSKFRELLKDTIPWMWTRRNGALVNVHHTDLILRKDTENFEEVKLVYKLAMDWEPENHSIWKSEAIALAKLLRDDKKVPKAISRLLETANALYTHWQRGEEKLRGLLKPTKPYRLLVERLMEMSVEDIPTITMEEIRDRAMVIYNEELLGLSQEDLDEMESVYRNIVANFVDTIERANIKRAIEVLDYLKALYGGSSFLFAMCINAIAHKQITEETESSIFVPLYLLGDDIIKLANSDTGDIDFSKVSKEGRKLSEELVIKTLIFKKGSDKEIGKEIEIGSNLLIDGGDVLLSNGLEANLSKDYMVKDGEYIVISKKPYVLSNGEISSKSTWVFLKEVK